MDYKSAKVLMLGAPQNATLDEEKGPGSNSGGIISNLKEMEGEYAQLSELEEMERNYADKVVESLKAVQNVVEEPIPIEKAALGPSYNHVKEAFLASGAVVVLFNANGISSALPLSKFGAREILSIVQSATPHLIKVIARRRKETGERVEILEKILKEMKKTGISVKRDLGQYRAPEEEDLVSSSIAHE